MKEKHRVPKKETKPGNGGRSGDDLHEGDRRNIKIGKL
jgi:hypothetical protein